MSARSRRSLKPSGVQWLGDVPEHWQVLPIRYVARLESGHTPSRSRPEWWENCTVPWFSLSDIWQVREEGRSVITDTAEMVSELGLANSSARVLPAGTVMLSRTASVGFAAIMGVDMATTQDFANWVCGPRLNNEFLLWTFRAMRPEFSRLMMGSTHNTIYMPDIASFRLALPTLPEQATIATFLSRETGKIDALVEEQRRLIELLKEKHQAVISHAVTKGLDPNAKMKPSGVEWLGDVPEHWEVRTVGAACAYLSYGFTNPMPTADEGPFMLTANDVQDGYIDFNGARHTSREAFDQLTAKSRPLAGDVLVTKDGTLGRVALYDGPAACINQSVAILRPNESVEPAFLAVCLRGGVYQDRMVYEAGGTTIKHIYISRLAKMPLAKPPLAEQAEITRDLAARSRQFDQLVVEASRAVELLIERRAALISAAVTGKVDVRNQASEQEAA